MKTINDADDSDHDLTELDTGEYPSIKEVETPTVEPLNGRHHAQADNGKAAFWLNHLESEINRLHERWHSIDGEFKLREKHIAELREELETREASVEKLTTELGNAADALKTADERIAAKEAEIAGLIDGGKERDRKIEEFVASVEEAGRRHEALEGTLKRAQTEVARLEGAVRQERETAAGVGELNEELLAEQGRLRLKLQDLETYIDGRHQSWSELKAQLTNYKDALVGMERTLKARDAAVARFDEEKRQLAARILDLERQCSELTGRRKEREVAYQELQQKLAEHFEATEQLKADHASRAKETEEALAKAGNNQKLIESLERGITRRDDNLVALGAEIEQQKAAVEELTAAKEKLAKRAEELEKTLQERTLQAQGLREELRASHDQLRTAKDQLKDRAAELEASHDLAQAKAQLATKLDQELRALEKEAADVRSDLARLEAHSSELGELRSETLAENERLKAEITAQQELIASLEAELRLKQATTDLLERNIGRITDLGASLAALDRNLDGADEKRLDDPFIETIASEQRNTDASQEMLSFDLLAGDQKGGDVVDVGEPLAGPATRKLIALVGDLDVDYPLIKKEMTIGRGHDSDIRIASHYISRVHAKVSTSGIGTIIEDAGSKNGILVNSERVHKRVLRDGDIVNLGGELKLRFVDAAP